MDSILALGIFACTAVKYWRLDEAFDLNDHLRLIILAFAGLVAFVGSEEWSEWTGRYGWTRQQWWMTPSWYIRMTGGIMLVYHTTALYRL